MNTRLIILSALLLAGSRGVYAMEWYIGGAPHYYVIDNDYGPIDGQSSEGFHLIMGTRWEHLALEVTMGGGSIDTEEIMGPFFPADSADYAIIDLTAKYLFRFKNNDRLIPWVGAGAGFHFVDWNNYVYGLDGTAFSLSAGLDVRLIYSLYLTGGLKYHFVDGTTDDQGTFSGTTTEASVGLIWVFGEGSFLY